MGGFRSADDKILRLRSDYNLDMAKAFTRSLVAIFLFAFSAATIAQTPQPTLEQAAARWKSAVGAHGVVAVLTTTSTQDGVSGTVTEAITAKGDYREETKREFDQGEVVLTSTLHARKDWQGYVRKLEGLELKRFLTAEYIDRALIFGPAADAELGGVTAGDKPDSYILNATPRGGSEVQWLIDAKSGLPLRSKNPGQDSTIIETFSDWKDFGGVKTAASATVTETNKPDYTWKRESVRFTRTYPFAAPTPGPSDTTLAANAPPIPFRMEADHIIFDIAINGHTMPMLLDTGDDIASMNSEYAQQLGLKPYGGTKTTGGGNTTDYLFATGATFTLPGAEVRDQHVAILDETGLEKALGIKLAGLLGFDFISRFVIEIDYQKHLMYLHHPKTWKYTGSGTIVPIIFDEGIPFTHAMISAGDKKNIPAYFVIDFGAQETMTLTAPFARKNDLYAAAALNKVNRSAGLEKEFFAQQNVRGKIDELDLDGLKIQNIPVNMSVNKTGAYASEEFSGTIGQGIYKRYHVFLDYQRARLILEPTPAASEAFKGRSTYGMSILASGPDYHTYTVTAVRDNSPAAQDGFAKGDVVISLDRRPSSQFTLSELRAALAEDGTSHQLTVQRQGAEKRFDIKVRVISLD